MKSSGIDSPHYTPVSARQHGLISLAIAITLACTPNAFAQKRPVAVISSKAKTNAVHAAVPVPVDAAPVLDRQAIGATIYSTALEPVWIRIVPKPAGDATYVSRIYVVLKGTKQYLGTNRDNKSLALGRVAAGDLQILIETPGEGLWSSGPGSRNADQLPHALARDVSEGLVEVRFEDLRGLPEERLTHGNATEQQYARQHYFRDVIVQVGGGVTADATVPALIESLQSSNPELRKTAADALRQTHPRMARALGLFTAAKSGR